MPNIDPMLASATFRSTPSSRQRADSIACMYSIRSLQFLHVPGDAGFFEQTLQFGPEEFFGAGGILVKSGAAGAPRALELVHHAVDQRERWMLSVRLALGSKIGQRLLARHLRELHRHFVGDRERPHRHPAWRAAFSITGAGIPSSSIASPSLTQVPTRDW